MGPSLPRDESRGLSVLQFHLKPLFLQPERSDSLETTVPVGLVDIFDRILRFWATNSLVSAKISKANVFRHVVLVFRPPA